MEKSCKSALTFLASRSIFMIFGTLHFSLKSLKKEKKSPSIFFLTLKYRLFFYRVLWKRVFENQTASNTSALKVNVMSFFRCSFRVLGITPVLLDHCAIEKTMTKFLENISLKTILIPLAVSVIFVTLVVVLVFVCLWKTGLTNSALPTLASCMPFFFY